MAIFLDENVAQGLSERDPYKVGISDVDDGQNTFDGVLMPWVIDPVFSFLDYVCWFEYELDSGMAVHRQLPQSVQAVDSLGIKAVDDATLPSLKDQGANLASVGNFTDVVQRMGHSIYRICLKGWSRRAGYRIPIPKVLKIGVVRGVGGIDVVPDDRIPQRVVDNIIVANNSGIPIYYAQWELWYTTAAPPRQQQDPPANLSEHIDAVDPAYLPDGIQVPLTYPDMNAKVTGPDLDEDDPDDLP